MDPKLEKNHTVAIDGSLFEKWPAYRRHIKDSLRAIVKGKARKISLALTKDGSGIGAAVVAATASLK
jgi:hexokinase